MNWEKCVRCFCQYVNLQYFSFSLFYVNFYVWISIKTFIYRVFTWIIRSREIKCVYWLYCNPTTPLTWYVASSNNGIIGKCYPIGKSIGFDHIQCILAKIVSSTNNEEVNMTVIVHLGELWPIYWLHISSSSLARVQLNNAI